MDSAVEKALTKVATTEAGSLSDFCARDRYGRPLGDSKRRGADQITHKIV
jgi:hypothetical protein